jgi:hypothetical protein
LKGREETLIGSEDRLAGAVEQVRRDLFRVARLPNSSRTYVATNATWKDKESGEYKTRTEWHRVVVWAKFGEWASCSRKVRWPKSKANCGIANFSRRAI